MHGEYDPDRARQLLAEAGYPDGFDLCVVSLHSDMDAYVSAIGSYLLDIGIGVDNSVPRSPDCNVLYLTPA